MSATARKILATLNRIMSPTTDAAESLIDLESPFGTTVDITTRHKRLATRKQKKQEFLKAERPESEEFKMEPPPSEALITPPPKHKQKQVHLMDISRPSSEMKIKTQTPASVKGKQEFKSFDEEAESLSTTSGLRRKRKKSKSKSKSKSELKQERNIQTTVRKIDKCIVDHHSLFLFSILIISNNKLLIGFSQIKRNLKIMSQKMSLKLIPMTISKPSIQEKKKNHNHNERNLKLLQILELIWTAANPLLKMLSPLHRF